jgi:hypothetical protein
MDSYNPMVPATDFTERMERLYPETAAILAPHAREMVDALSEEAVDAVSSMDIGRMAADVMRRSGMEGNLPHGHTRDTLGDMTKALVVRELIDRHRRRGFDGRFGGRADGRFMFPFFFFPFDGRHFGFDHRGFGGHHRI